MEAQHQEFVDLAFELLSEEGRQMTHRHVEDGPKNPQRPWDKAPPDKSDQKIISVLTNYKREMINGTTILKGDKLAYVAAKGLKRQIAEKDMFFDEGEWYTVKNVEEVKPGNTPILYFVQLRR